MAELFLDEQFPNLSGQAPPLALWIWGIFYVWSVYVGLDGSGTEKHQRGKRRKKKGGESDSRQERMRGGGGVEKEEAKRQKEVEEK